MITVQPDVIGRVLVLALLTGTTGSYCSPRAASSHDLEITSVYIAEPVMGERAAMYFTVKNAGSTADHLVGVSTPVAALAEIHRTFADGGMMRMEPVESLQVSPGESLRLSPGGYHVMLLALEQQIEPGEIVEATLTFRRAGPLSVQARVISLPKLEGVLDSATGSGTHH